MEIKAPKTPIKSAPLSTPPTEERVISVQELASLARHPWRFYLRKKFGIWIRGEETLGLQKALWLREVLTRPVEAILQELPPGLVGEAIALEVKEKAAEWKRPFFTAAFLESCRKMRWVDATRVELPCLTIGQVRIVGEVQHLTHEALIVPGDDSLAGLLKVWPEWLCAAMGLGVRQVECLKSGKMRQIEEPEQWLKQFLDYFFAAEQALSPLLPEWADAVLRGGKKRAFRFDDPVIDWVFARHPPEFSAEWDRFLQEALGGFIALFPRRERAAV